MNEILDDFKKSFENIPYKIIKDSMVYCSQFIIFRHRIDI